MRCINCGAKRKINENICPVCGVNYNSLKERKNWFQKFSILLYAISLGIIISIIMLGNNLSIIIGSLYLLTSTILFFFMYSLAIIIHEVRLIKRFLRENMNNKEN